jgi:hypothetical protein
MYPVEGRRKPVLIMENLQDLEFRIRRAMSRLDDVKGVPGFEDVDVDRLRAVLAQILARVRQMSLN